MAVISIRIERRPAGDGAKQGPSTRRRLLMVATAGTAVGALALVGVAVATPTTSTTDVAFVTLTPAHKVLSATIAANKSTVAVGSGGSTTVPTNATTVQLVLTAKGAAAGVINIYPTGNVSGGSGQFLSYPAGNHQVSATIEENIGQANELTFANSGSGSAIVTATVTGYSTQVTAGDIGGTGGAAGQVLTNNGAGGAAWQNLNATQLGGSAGSAGQNLTNNGAGGASWQTQGQAFGSQSFYTPLGGSGALQTIDSLTVPAGSYSVHAEVEAIGNNNDFLCYIVTPGNYYSNGGFAQTDAAITYAPFGVQSLVSTTGGTITLQCEQYFSGGAIYDDSLIATQVNSVSGYVLPFAHARPSRAPARPLAH